jgi:hypothetical protein
MFSDTLTVTWASVANTFTRVNQDKYSSEYRFADNANGITCKLFIRHTSYKSKVDGLMYDRHNVEFQFVDTNIDPSIPAIRLKTYFVFELPSDSGTATQLQALSDMITTFLAISNAETKLANWES